MTEARNPLVDHFNGRLVLTGAVLSAWFAVRGDVLGAPSGPTVVIEWFSLLLLTVLAVWSRWNVPNIWGLSYVCAGGAIVYLTASFQHQPDLGEWSMYWRGFGPRLTFSALVIAAILAFVWPSAKTLLSRQPQGPVLRFAITAARVLGVGALAWMLPTLLQPQDAWLNIGDATEKVLDEIAGPLVGNVPGYNQSSGYSTLLGMPLLPLNFVGGFSQEKFTVLVLWVNALVLLVPLLIAAIMRRVWGLRSWLLALVLACATVTVSGRPFGNEPKLFDFNTSVFRELSFLARGVFPLVLGLLVVEISARPRINKPHLAFLAVVAAISVLNNPEFGVGSAVAAGAVVMFQEWGTVRLWSSFRFYCAVMAASLGVLVAPGMLFGGDWVSRRLGMFVAVLSGEGATLSANSARNIPALGVITVTYAVAIASIAAAVFMKRSSGVLQHPPATSVALYFGLWTLISSPYMLNAGGAGGFGTQFHLIPLVIMSVALVRMLNANTSTSAKSQRFFVVPVLLLLSVGGLAVSHSPNALVEWRRIQQPIDDQKWTDEWSPQQLDWVRPAEVTRLAETAGGVSEVGWWYSHGNAIELLTGIENLLGTSVFEGAIKGAAIRKQACEPLGRSTVRYVITDERYISLVAQCGGVASVSVVQRTESGLVLLSVDR